MRKLASIAFSLTLSWGTALLGTTFLGTALLGTAFLGTAFLGTTAHAQTLVSTQETYVCPKCGKVHVRKGPTSGARAVTTPSSRTTVAPVVYQSTPSYRSTSGSSASDQAGSYQATSAAAPVASSSRLRAGRGIANVLAALNAQRARQGVPSLRYDPQLQAVAQRRAQRMASSGLKNHPPGSFAPGRYEGVGWSSSYSPAGVSACYTSDSRMRYAGAAMATGRDGVYFAVVYR